MKRWTLTAIFAAIFIISGCTPNATFSPNNIFVSHQVHSKNTAKAVMIYAHGGSGMGNSDRQRANLFYFSNIDVIYFDAFEMNGLHGSWVNLNVNDLNKQKMIVDVLVGAIQHANAQGYEHIALYGQSNGAKAVLAVLDRLQAEEQARIRFIIAEAPAADGLALPNNLKIPTYLFIGDRDNWGGVGETDYLWTRHNRFSWGTNKSWYDQQLAQGNPVKLTVYSEAGHSFHSGLLHPVTRVMTNGFRTTGYLGSHPRAVIKYEDDIKTIINQHFDNKRSN
jgi:dienelactone hydrolase